jgi:UDP-N-acetyl-2-amino-2-deoxyglucuronate dehydrogenase
MKNFAIIGIGGYIANRHLEAIYQTNNNAIAAYDPTDSVGMLDRYSKDIQFFKTFEEFYYFLKTTNEQLDYVSICSPNYLHRSHIMLALDLGANVICEKPLVLCSQDIEALRACEKASGKKVFNILQLREHEAIVSLKEAIKQQSSNGKHKVNLTYITSRGPWYHQTWKADPIKSGGITFNIGIHFFDMLTWIFGDLISSEVHVLQNETASGYLELENAEVNWFLSIDKKFLPKESIAAQKPTYRSITIDGKELEFSDGFTDLHTKVYQSILDGKGYGLDAAENAIKIVESLNNQNPKNPTTSSHPFLSNL